MTAASLANIGQTFQSLGKHEQALQYYQKGLEIKLRIYKSDHPSIAASLASIGQTFQSLGRYEQALKYYQTGLEINRKVYKGDHPDIAASLNNIGATLENLGKYDKALKYQQESLEMMHKVYKGNHAHIAASLNNIGNTFDRLGEYKKALMYQQEGLQMMCKVYKGDHPDIATSLMNIGNTLDRLGEYEKAYNCSTQAISMFSKLLPPEHTHIKTANVQLLKSTIALANQEILSDNLKKGLEYYATIYTNIALENLPTVMYDFANQFWQIGEMNLMISCYEALSEKLIPTNKTIKHNLACVYHAKALKGKEQGYDDRYLKYLSKAQSIFESAINLSSEEAIGASTYTEYAQFLLKYHHKNNKKEYAKISKLLQNAISLEDDPSLGYNQLEKCTVCGPLQELLDKQNEISVSPKFLACYLMVKLHLMHDNIKGARGAFEEFKKQVASLQPIQANQVSYYLLDSANKEISNNEKFLKFNQEGTAYFRKKNYIAAIQAFSQSISIKPTAENFYNRGRSYYENGNFDDAIKDYQEILKINPEHAKAFCHLGLCYQKNSNHSLAKAYLRHAITIDRALELAQTSLRTIKAVTVIQRSWRQYIQHGQQSQEQQRAI